MFLQMVKSIEEIGDASAPKTSSANIEQNQDLPKVTIIHTGGTIASKVDYATGAVIARFEPEELLASVPEILEIANIDAVKLGNMWSDDIRPLHWNKMIDACQEAFDSGSTGVVITHGTDTMVETAKVLAKEIKDKTIVLTGAMIPYKFGSSDGLFNLGSALSFVQAMPLGVFIAMNGNIFHWNNVKKNKALGLFEEIDK